ncbi:MAG: hypothetical protein WCO52_06690, partial [bacterium]
MTEELELGLIENSYIRLAPNRGGVVENSRPERLEWPWYVNAERSVPDSGCGCSHYDESSTLGTTTT